MRDFEVSIYEIVPERRGTCYMAQDIVASLNQEGRYEDVYKEIKKWGMNA